MPPPRAARGPLRVCHLAYTFYESDQRVIRYAEALAERGDRVDVIALRRPGQARSASFNGVRVHRIQRREVTERSQWAYLLKLLWFCVKSTLLLAFLHLRRPYHVVHVHNVPDFLVFAAVLPRWMGARVVLDIHDILPELYGGKFGVDQRSTAFRWLLGVERLSCRVADHVIVANDLWHEKLVRRSVPAGKCTAILNYPDLRRFKPLPQGGGRADGKFLILYPGTLNHHQGLDVAIEAFGLVRAQMPDAEFHIYGEGPARPELARLARERGLTGPVKLMDHVPLSEVGEVIASANVGVVPKRANGFGNEAFSTKILEFMACEVPVIISRTKVDAHYFDDTLVRYFASEEEAELAQALLEAYEDRFAGGERVRAARQFAIRNSWQAHAADYLRIVDLLVA
jgi:glycosyltransferase involved in cell wall biosynthesis